MVNTNWFDELMLTDDEENEAPTPAPAPTAAPIRAHISSGEGFGGKSPRFLQPVKDTHPVVQ